MNHPVAAARVMELYSPDDPNARNFNGTRMMGYMLAPSDPALRIALEARYRLKIILGAEPESGIAEQFALLPEHRVALADDSVMRRVYLGAVEDGGRKGQVCGQVLGTMLQISRSPDVEPSLQLAVHIASMTARKARRWGDGQLIASTPRQLLSHWSEYRQVAHLWCAHTLVSLHCEFSYESHVLLQIELAEALRHWLEAFVPLRAPGPLVAPDELWRPPASYPIAGYDLGARFGPLDEQTAAWAKTYKTSSVKKSGSAIL